MTCVIERSRYRNDASMYPSAHKSRKLKLFIVAIRICYPIAQLDSIGTRRNLGLLDRPRGYGVCCMAYTGNLGDTRVSGTKFKTAPEVRDKGVQ